MMFIYIYEHQSLQSSWPSDIHFQGWGCCFHTWCVSFPLLRAGWGCVWWRAAVSAWAQVGAEILHVSPFQK